MSAAKAVHRLMRTIKTLSDGQANVGEIDWDDGELRCFKLEIQPSSGFFKGGTFVFSILLEDSYPGTEPPVVRCETDIYHPNINTCDGNDGPQDINDPAGTNVCLNLFDDDIWNASYGLESIVLGLLFLLNNPNFESPLSEQFGGDETVDEFRENVDHYMKGEPVDGTYYDVHFRSDVADEAMMHVASDTDVTKTGCDVDSMNEMCASGGEGDTKNTLTKQDTLVLPQQETLVKQGSLIKQASLVNHESLVKQGSLLKQNSLIKQGSLVKQGTLLAQGSLVKQGCLVKQGSSVEQGILISQGSLVKQESSEEQGTLISHGSLVKQESSVEQGTLMSQGSLVKQESVLKHGNLVKQGSLLKQESLIKLCSLVKEASIKKLSSIVSQAEEADAEFDKRAMKLITVDGETVLFNDFSCQDDDNDMDTS